MDLRALALKNLKGAFGVFTKDLKALPEEAFTRDFGGKTRTIADLVYEVNLVNDHVGMALKGNAPEWIDQGWIKAPKEFCDKQAILDAFEKSSSQILSTIEACTPEQIEDKVVTDGKETSRFERCQFICLHVWYHSGQLNYIQTLLGDDEWHW